MGRKAIRTNIRCHKVFDHGVYLKKVPRQRPNRDPITVKHYLWGGLMVAAALATSVTIGYLARALDVKN